MDWGPKVEDSEAIAALHKAIDLGVNFIDTADVYGHGHSEELIARVRKERKEELIIATKAGNNFYERERHQDFSRKYLMFAVEQSLKRLGVEALDLLQLHGPDAADIQKGEIFEVLDTLKRDGKIRFAGISVRSFHDDEGVLAVKSGQVDALQVRYNLLEWGPADEVFPLAKEHNIGIIVRIPLLFGVLTGKFTRATRFSEGDHRQENLSPEKLAGYLDQMVKLFFLFQGTEITMAQTALRFILSNDVVSTVIPGAKRPSQAAENCAASDLGPLPPDLLARIAAVIKGT
jgi:aryl-alcohol dehydrogenase-like predicted oxidoreductase